MLLVYDMFGLFYHIVPVARASIGYTTVYAYITQQKTHTYIHIHTYKCTSTHTYIHTYILTQIYIYNIGGLVPYHVNVLGIHFTALGY